MWLLNGLLIRKVVIIMPRIGLRELKIHASEVLRDVQKNRVRYVITRRGEPQAIIVPYSPSQECEPTDREMAWTQLVDALDEVRKNWTSPRPTRSSAGADAVYAATARRFDAMLVTLEAFDE